jgi:hypothetical protein
LHNLRGLCSAAEVPEYVAGAEGDRARQDGRDEGDQDDERETGSRRRRNATFRLDGLITHRQASPSETREACAGRTGLVEHRESAHLREHACTRPSRLNRQDAGQRRKDDQNLKPTKPARHGIHTSL